MPRAYTGGTTKAGGPGQTAVRTARRAPAEEAHRAFAGAGFAGVPVGSGRDDSGLPPRLRANVERLSGVSLDGVKVHYRSARPARIRAHAFAQGSQIHIGPGQERHLAHEAWHAAQQRRRHVRPLSRIGSLRLNEDPVLEREADVMGERASLLGDLGSAAPVPRAIAATPGFGQAPVQPKKIIRADGSIHDVDEGYELRQGERNLQEPTDGQLGHRQSAFRGALDPTGTDTSGGGKYAFPFSFFDHAFPPQPGNVPITFSGNRRVDQPISRPSDSTTPARLLPMLPHQVTEDGNLDRLLQQPDPSGHGVASASSNVAPVGPQPVTIDRLREAMTGLEYARRENIDPGSVTRESATIDFSGTRHGTGEKALFDPFMSPQPEAPSVKQLGGAAYQQANPNEVLPGPFRWKPENAKAAAARRGTWAEDAYTKHTNESKGQGTVGLWDTTSENQGEVDALDQMRQARGVGVGRVRPIDLGLDRAYAREDFLARQQIQHRNEEQYLETGDQRHLRHLSGRERLVRWRALTEERVKRQRERRKLQEERQRRRKERRLEPRGEAPAWGGKRPDDPDDSGWGQNHPLYWRHGWRRGGGGSSGGAISV